MQKTTFFEVKNLLFSSLFSESAKTKRENNFFFSDFKTVKLSFCNN